MAKKLDKVEREVVGELSTRVMTQLHAALHYLDVIAVTETARETAMVRTKIQEAQMWLRAYEESLEERADEK